MTRSTLIYEAELFAREAHARQVRKYTGMPYIVHPMNVAKIVSEVTDDPVTIAVAWLHDTVEDTSVTFAQIGTLFGREVADLVADVTNITKKTDGNRAFRKALERTHLAMAAPKAKTVKLADMLDNIPSTVQYDPGFAVTYVDEKRRLLGYLRAGNRTLWDRAVRLIEQSTELLRRKT
jgi:(p)ppGpp synthase/HD superfamily hydrolase